MRVREESGTGEAPADKRMRLERADAQPPPAPPLPPALLAYARALLQRALDEVQSKLAAARCLALGQPRLPICALVDQMALLTACPAAGAHAESFRLAVKALAGALRGRWELAEALLLSATLSVPDALRQATAHREASDRARRVIGGHHQALRLQVVARADARQSAEAAWSAAVSNTAALEDYAEAASTTGRRSFVREAQNWCVDTARGFYFSRGAAKAAVKAHKRIHFAHAGAPLPAHEADAMEAAVDAEVTAALRDSHLPRLLDIGSCHDPWRALSSQFEVTALDLQPASALVHRCDFLQLVVDGAAPVIAPEPPSAGHLLSLPPHSFHVAVLSLVLSYIPDPLHRTRVVAKARQLLHNSAGLLLIVTPISTDASFTPRRALPVLQEWRDAIEALGFERYAVVRLRAVHALAFRCVAMPPETPLRPMRIAYDARVQAACAEERA